MDKPMKRTTRKRKAEESDVATDEIVEKKPKTRAKQPTAKVTKVTSKEKQVKTTRDKKKTGASLDMGNILGNKKTKLKSKDKEETDSIDVLDGIGPSTSKQYCSEPYTAQNEITCMWDDAVMLSHVAKTPLNLARNFVSLLNEGCTLPFIARYRKTAVDNLLPDRKREPEDIDNGEIMSCAKLPRLIDNESDIAACSSENNTYHKLLELFEAYQNVTQLKKKVTSVIETLKKSKKLTPEVQKSLLNARNLSEVELVYAPLKSHSLSLAERARNLGLEPHAIQALNGDHIKLETLCTDADELANVGKVDEHITHLVADIIYKDTRVLEQIRSLKEETRFTIQSSRTKSSTKEKKEDNSNKKTDSRSDPETYKLYFEWKCPSHFIKPHQTLAINRGEDEKILSVKVNVPDWFYNKLERFCLTLWKSKYWVSKGVGDAYNRLIKPWLSRQVRADLTNVAQKEAVKTFINNLEKYLLTEPIKNRRIAGLDPGFRAGCKVGIIDTNGEKLEACAIHPDFRRYNPTDYAAKQLKDLLTKHKVELIGLGNGTACRETETWLKDHQISQNIPVIIVPEQGASIYSISKEAQKEHPNMDPNLISALSIARRVLDPLGELIKVDPKNLGVGLYQHDIPPKMLESALDNAVEKVVSLVGVDINTASQAMLRRISGLNDGRASKIIAYRQEHNRFNTRAEILKVAGIGKITYQQCAGFLKVLGGSEPLDSTIIHPESYKVAKLLAQKINVNIKELTRTDFPAQVERRIAFIDLNTTSKELNTDVSTLELIVNAFKQKPHEDNIISFCRPVYSLSVQATEQIKEGMTLQGVVRNVVPFGCFVDCGVGDNGLIHSSQMAGHQTPKLGDRVSVTVIASPKPKKLQLRLEKILN